MHDLPFAIPESLASYVVQYESDPDKTIRRLKKQLKKRGPDAVGYFLLGWFYHRKDLQEKAIQCAIKAKTFAPGSPFFDKLHYFFQHPRMFKAWQHYSKDNPTTKRPIHSSTVADPILDLNRLIEKLSTVDKKLLSNNDLGSLDAGSDLSNDSDNVDKIASETLANIYEQQGKLDAAILAYQRLKKSNNEKEEIYNKEIHRLKDLKKDRAD